MHFKIQISNSTTTHLEQEDPGLAAVRAGEQLRGGEVLHVEPGGAAAHLAGEVSALNLPRLELSLQEAEVHCGGAHGFCNISVQNKLITAYLIHHHINHSRRAFENTTIINKQE